MPFMWPKQVENTLFRLFRSTFVRHSAVFKDLFSLPTGHSGAPVEGNDDDNPLHFSGISAIDFGIIRRPFATVQQPADAETTPTKSTLRSRLAYIDERLKDFRRRDQTRRRSQSPF